MGLADIFRDAQNWLYEKKAQAEAEGKRIENMSFGDYLKDSLSNFANNMQNDPAGMALNFIPFGMEIKPVYHGSPYKFDRFSNEKIGTGEGAQAFGYGHYLTDSVDVARDYATKNSRNIGGIKQSIKDEIEGAQLNIKNGYWIDDYNRKHTVDETYKQRMLNFIKDKENELSKYTQAGTNNLYTSTINKGKPASEDVFLEWDKPLREQSDSVKKALNKVLGINTESWLKSHRTGKDLYNQAISRAQDAGLTLGKNEREIASKMLNKAGITGIKYPSGTLSGIKGSPHYNYVVFNPEDITIDKINDIPINEMWEK